MNDTSVSAQAPPRQARRPSPPEVPDEYGLTAQWSTGSPRVAVELYGHRDTGTAHIRLIDNAGSMDAGQVVRGGTSKAAVIWTAEARDEYDAEWLDGQAEQVKELLSHRWRAS